MDNNNNSRDNDMMTDNDTDDDEGRQVCRFDPNLVRKLLQFRPKHQSRNSNNQNHHQQAPPRISKEAVLAAGELLRLFVLETRHRASIDAECEQEGDSHISNLTSQSSSGGDKKKSSEKEQEGVVQIRSDHITKVAAEMLMDFA